jgi:hypothetical protein
VTQTLHNLREITRLASEMAASRERLNSMLKCHLGPTTIDLRRDQVYLGVGVLGILAVINLSYGFAYKIPATQVATYFRIWSCLFVACLMLLIYGGALSRRTTVSSVQIAPWLAPVVTAATLISTLYFSIPTRFAFILTGIVVAGCAPLLWAHRYWTCIVLLLTMNVAISIVLVEIVPIDRLTADMLPVIADANTFLMHGANPYTQVYSNKFLYLPIQWLAFLPFVATGLDLRVLNLICLASLSAWIVWLVARGRLGPLALVVGCPILVSRTAVAMVLSGQVWPYWWLVVAFAVSLLFPGWILSAAIVGVLLATQQTAVAIAALFGIYLFFAVGWNTSVRVMMIAFLIFGLIMLPWVILQPALPKYLYIGIQKTFALEHELDPRWDWSEVSILNLLQAMGIGHLRALLQIFALLSGALYLALVRGITLRTFTCVTGIVYLFAVSLNVQVFRYYYYPGLLLIALGLSIPADFLAPWIGTARMRIADPRT